MLSSLTIRNVVLIDSLDLEGQAGLCALTGETGAGKSILLDALGLALGARGDSSLVRHGAEQAVVTAAFDVAPKHPVFALLKEQGIDSESEVILRRVVGSDGRGKAFINDTPVSIQFLKEAGSTLVEIHGQFDTRGLLDPATHRAALDAYAGIDTKDLRAAHRAWRDADKALEDAKSGIDALRAQEDFLKHAVSELEDLAPKPGEEDELAARRARLLQADKIRSAVTEAHKLLEADNGILTLVGRLESLLEKAGAGAGDVLAPLKRAKAEIEDTSWQLNRLDPEADGSLEDVEDRYFALRACAKKHRVTTDELPDLLKGFTQKLTLVTDQDAGLAQLEKAAAAAKKDYMSRAGKVSEARNAAAGKLSKAVQKELPDLKLEKATFHVDCALSEETAWGPEGIDRVHFAVATNPGAPAGPLHKIASGGEMARFLLATKAVLAKGGGPGTLVFDEVDSGIGGATADAVGERLARLAKTHQVLVVTHSPQVAARAAHHWHVAKSEAKGAVTTSITALSTIESRADEIARMLSGKSVTKEAKAQAQKLLEGRDAA